MQLYTGAVGLGLSTVLLPWYWDSLTPALWAWLGLLGVLGLLGHQFLIGAYRHAPASSLTPFLYLQIAFAMLMGWLMFNQVPDLLAWLGVGLIAACGVAGTWLAAQESAAARSVMVDEPLD
jgi:drug/metabolite transporter (DMT)-like permease